MMQPSSSVLQSPEISDQGGVDGNTEGDVIVIAPVVVTLAAVVAVVVMVSVVADVT